MSNVHINKFVKYYEQIRLLYKAGKTCKEIVEEIDDPELSVVRVQKIASLIGCAKPNEAIRKKYEEIDKQALELLKENMSLKQISVLLKVDAQSLSRRLKLYYNAEILTDGKKHVESDIFSTIDTEEKAYWLGFLYADGYVSNRNEFELTLQVDDELHIEKFKKFLKSNHKIGNKIIQLDGKEFYAKRLSIKDSKLASDLKRHGCISCKSFTIEYPSFRSEELNRAFLRGYFDGDGSVSTHLKKITVGFSCASLNFLLAIQQIVAESIGVKTFIKSSRSKAYDLRITSKQGCICFLYYIYYKSTIHLDRKYNKFLDFCRQENIPLDFPDYEDGIKRENRKDE